MITRSPLPPAMAYVQAHGDMLTQLGATKVEATDAFTVTATYADSAHAFTADALLKDSIWGAKLVVASEQQSTEPVAVTADGVADLLRGVAGLRVSNLQTKGPESHSLISAVSTNSDTVTLLNDLVEANPAPGIFVSVAAGVPSPFQPTPEA